MLTLAPSWTIQELVVARQAVLQCGRHKLPWKRLEQAQRGFAQHAACCATFLQSNWSVGDLALLFDQALGRTMGFRAKFHGLTLQKLLEQVWGQQATDKRDFIFALLNLLASAERIVEVDYTRPYGEVLKETALAIMRHEHSVEHLALASDGIRNRALPSWVSFK